MKAFYDQVRDGLRRWIGEHPSAVLWIALRDNQLSATQTRKLEAHLRTCETCGSEWQSLDETFALFLQAETSSKGRQLPVDEGVMQLQEQIRVWRQNRGTRNSPASVDPREPWQQASAELEAYLGPQMTARLIETAIQSTQEVRGILVTASPVLTGLLGERTAFNVTTQLFKIFAPERAPRER